METSIFLTFAASVVQDEDSDVVRSIKELLDQRIRPENLLDLLLHVVAGVDLGGADLEAGRGQGFDGCLMQRGVVLAGRVGEGLAEDGRGAAGWDAASFSDCQG